MSKRQAPNYAGEEYIGINDYYADNVGLIVDNSNDADYIHQMTPEEKAIIGKVHCI